MTRQVIQVRDGIGVVSPSVGIEHLVEHAESSPAAKELLLIGLPVHCRGELGRQAALEDAPQGREELS
eukprot:3710465-Heterocapsa_arctica.AAC.1